VDWSGAYTDIFGATVVGGLVRGVHGIFGASVVGGLDVGQGRTQVYLVLQYKLLGLPGT